MSESKHTPGPWGVKWDDFDDAWHVTPDGLGEPPFGDWVPVCVVDGDDNANEANARLIAAAPEMYVALVGGLETLRQVCDGQHEDNMCCHHLRAIEAALAKARGDV